MTGYARTRVCDPAEQVAVIVGCVYRNGACVVHQRSTDTPRPGCPYVESILREARVRVATI